MFFVNLEYFMYNNNSSSSSINNIFKDSEKYIHNHLPRFLLNNNYLIIMININAPLHNIYMNSMNFS